MWKEYEASSDTWLNGVSDIQDSGIYGDFRHENIVGEETVEPPKFKLLIVHGLGENCQKYGSSKFDFLFNRQKIDPHSSFTGVNINPLRILVGEKGGVLYSYDHRGHGSSSCSPSNKTIDIQSSRIFLEDFVQALEKVKEDNKRWKENQKKSIPIIILAVSFGSIIVRSAIIENPNSFDGVTGIIFSSAGNDPANLNKWSHKNNVTKLGLSLSVLLGKSNPCCCIPRLSKIATYRVKDEYIAPNKKTNDIFAQLLYEKDYSIAPTIRCFQNFRTMNKGISKKLKNSLQMNRHLQKTVKYLFLSAENDEMYGGGEKVMRDYAASINSNEFLDVLYNPPKKRTLLKCGDNFKGYVFDNMKHDLLFCQQAPIIVGLIGEFLDDTLGKPKKFQSFEFDGKIKGKHSMITIEGNNLHVGEKKTINLEDIEYFWKITNRNAMGKRLKNGKERNGEGVEFKILTEHKFTVSDGERQFKDRMLRKLEPIIQNKGKKKARDKRNNERWMKKKHKKEIVIDISEKRV